MSTWGVAFISLGLLLLAYKNWFGILVIALGIVMMLVAKKNKKNEQEAEQEKIDAVKNQKIKSRK
ncbi:MULTISPECIES: hypothetical protein [unclassified Lactococcus]|uniref:hypothetical protein n=1 Tax=unclassified Lactococcus TaxID=2643510 RepID=UPI0011C7ECBD|nr:MULTISPECIES: hypothetical protein [unclassified Lactococcus]MQW22779.1 hypothetical protein [Lactococcus sp. dk101]TXK44783.1 hypothetical protein FVP42_04065 [Lactococcus sp. dk310]TXK50677.1 hypothetical protein FVP43_04065 [Lactococcus sp. dk322]